MRALIVDDEPLARERLAALLGDIGGVEVIGEAADGRSAVEAAGRLRPDLVLLDIRMPVMDGLEAARHLGRFEPAPAILFCTAYDDHALAAFEANAVDYVVKPVRSERLRAAIERARRFGGAELARRLDAGPPQRRSHLRACVRGNQVLVPIAAVSALQAEDKYVIVHHAEGQVLIEESLKALEVEFADRFVRIHRNCLVARERLSGLLRGSDGRMFVRVEGHAEPLEVSRRNLPALRSLVRVL